MVIDIQQPNPPSTDRSNRLWIVIAVVLLAIAAAGYAVYHVQVIANDEVNRDAQTDMDQSDIGHKTVHALVPCGRQCNLVIR